GQKVTAITPHRMDDRTNGAPAGERAGKTMSSLLIRNCLYIFTAAGEAPRRGEDILIEGNRIAAIGKGLQIDAGRQPSGGTTDATDGLRTIDGAHLVAIPGLVNTHHHFYQTLTRNLPAVQNAELFDWLVYLYEVWRHLDAEAVYYSSLLAMGELLKTGCTTTTDHHYLYPHAVTEDLMGTQFRAAEQLGIRFAPTRGSMCLSKKDGGLPPDTVVQTEAEILADSERVIDRYHDPSELSMGRVILAPCSPFSVTEALMQDTAALARRRGVRLHTHLAETEDENAFCEKMYGRRPLALMADCDFLGPDVSFAHGIHFTDAELDHLAASGTHIAHCPTSNMRLGSGICRVKEMLERGINVGLAVDGSASNDSSDMLGEVRNGLLLQRVRYGAAAIDAPRILQMGSRNGARLLGFDTVGELRPGWAADLALFDVNRMEYTGSLSDPLAAIIFSGYNHAAAYTIVNGAIAVDEGRLVGFAEEKIMEKGNQISARMLAESRSAWSTR
nr:8-oxoguanine deaminase [Desulfosarcinaceae bacterium]